MRYVVAIFAAAAPASAMVWGLGADVGLSIPVGDYGDIVRSSVVVDGRALFCLTPNLSLTAGVGYRLEHKPKYSEGAEDVSYDVIPILVGANYRFEYLPCMPYAGGGVAAAVSRATVPATAGTEEHKTTRLGPFAEGGMEYYVVENFGLDLRGRFLATLGGDKVTHGEGLVETNNYLAFDILIGLFFYP